PGARHARPMAADAAAAGTRLPGHAGLARGAGGDRAAYCAPMNNGSLPPAAALRLARGLEVLGIDPAAGAPLLDYLALLARWNRTYNLTAVRDPLEMVDRHLLDSLAMHRFVEPLAASGGRLADLGTGPGLPGIPLALACPGLRVTLVESNGKKARFLR